MIKFPIELLRLIHLLCSPRFGFHNMAVFNSIERQLLKLSFYNNLKVLTNQQKSKKLFENLNNLMKLVGVNIFSETFSVKSSEFIGKLVVPMISCGISMSFSFYIYINNIDKLLSLIVLLSLFCQVTVKLFVFLRNRNEILHLKQLCYDIIQKLNNPMQKRFKKWVMIGFHLNLFVGMISILSIVCLALLPLVFTLYNNQFILNYDFIIPFSNPEVTSGFVMNYLFQTFLIMLGVIGFAGSAAVIVNFILHSAAFFDCSEVYLTELKTTLTSPDVLNTKDKLSAILGSLIEIHNLNYNFIETFESCFLFYHMLDIGFSILTIVICIFGLTLVRILGTPIFINV